MNQKITDQLSQQIPKSDRYRARAYTTAITSIKQCNFQITSGKHAQLQLKGIGPSIAAKIDEIIQQPNADNNSGNNDIIDMFERVWGIGPVAARKYYDKGYRTLEALATDENLTKQQRIGLAFYDDLQQRMTREEATEIVEHVYSTVAHIDDIKNILGTYPFTLRTDHKS